MSNDAAMKTCEACGQTFGCGAKLDGCWCTALEIPDAQAALMRERFGDCLCPKCLAGFASRRAIKVTFPDGRVDVIEGAVRVDTQNFHEGMFDFYDDRGTLLKQMKMDSGITWDET